MKNQEIIYLERHDYMFIEERHQAILDILKEKRRISTSEIQEYFQISYDSAKRDLRILEEKGLLKRTHGGAIPLLQIATARPEKMTCKDIISIKENYMAIAKKALSMIHENDVIFLISSTLGYFIAQNIPDNLKLRVVTNSIVIAEELRKKDHILVIMLGGEMDHKGNFYDSIAVNMIKQLRFDLCFITSACISAKFGLSIQKTQAISFYNALIKSSRTVIGLYPTEKIGQDSVVSLCPANKLNILITDWNAPEDDLKEFQDSGIKLIIAEKMED